MISYYPLFQRTGRRRAAGFSLIELLTVIFIISLLIAILMPSLSNARNSAKRVSASALLSAIDTGLELFKNDNETEFGRTNGYPPSFVHPVIYDENGNEAFKNADGADGRYPFLKDYPRVYGAHFLVTFLMGADLNGFVQRRSVPKKLLATPEKWYEPDPDNGNELLDRASLYLEPSKLNLVPTVELIGSPPEDVGKKRTFPDWTKNEFMKKLPVIVDPFDQPVLYYVANRGGSLKNPVEQEHNPKRKYPDGKPVYFHQDNEGFTGSSENRQGGTEGWDFGGGGLHKIARHGNLLNATDIGLAENRDTFARYILDTDAFDVLKNREEEPTKDSPLRTVRKDSYLLITAGPDGLYGTNDDVTNIPRQD